VTALLAMIEDCQQRCALSDRRLCAAIGLSAVRLGRWRARIRQGRAPVSSGGPHKDEPLLLHELLDALGQLRHRARRTHGTGALYARFRRCISRRDLSAFVRQERTALLRRQREHWRHVFWTQVGVAWSIDGVQWPRDGRGRHLWLHPVQELCSRYRFTPLISVGEDGVAIARHLATLFAAHGAPLFLKRDNGGALNHAAVDAVLEAHHVLPLNSPVRYPRYNGAIENGIGETRRRLGWLHYAPACWDPAVLATFIQAAYLEMNYRPRRCLHGRSAADIFHQSGHRRFSSAQRRAALRWIVTCACAMLNHRRSRERRSISAAWRHAAESWLRCQGLITVATTKNVSPNYLNERYQ
jgi:hypothetical protein